MAMLASMLTRPWYAGLGQLFRTCQRPMITILCLLTGYTRCLTLPEPVPSPETIIHDREIVMRRYDGITILRQLSLFSSRDTPTMSLYRMYEFVSGGFENQLMLETNYFWSHSTWALAALPDPHDTNRERQAILACLVESLVNAFNMRTSLGMRRDEKKHHKSEMEQCPPWTAKVPPLPHELRLYDENEYDELFTEFFEDFVRRKDSSPFRKRNVFANAGNIWSI